MSRTQLNRRGNCFLSAEQPLPPEDHLCAATFGMAVDCYYRTHARRLIRQLRSRLGNSDEAREILHEALMRLLQRKAGKDGNIRKLEDYVARTSHNLIADQGRLSGRFNRFVEETASLPSNHVDQIVFLESRDTLRRLERAMMTLKPRTQQIFWAHRVDGFSYAEIAEMTGMTVKGVEKQMAKAIAKLSRFLDRA